MGRQGRDGSPGRRKLDPADAGADPEPAVDRGEPYGNHGASVRGGEGIPDTLEEKKDTGYPSWTEMSDG